MEGYYLYTREGYQDEYGNNLAPPYNVTTVEFDPSVKEIRESAFYARGELKSIVIPDGVEVVGADAFWG
eukprot:14293179-Ditylum_brightwellii.AAC.1